MDFFQGSPNAFQPPTNLPYTMPPSPYGGGLAPQNTQFSPLQQWQSPLVSNHQMWAHTVPNVMPWSTSNGPYSSEGIFAFSQLHPPYEPITPNIPPQNGAFYQPSATYPHLQQPPLQQQFFPPQTLPQTPQPSVLNPSSPPIQSSLNQNNKRYISSLDNDLEADANFDFESQRPVKKYISEDKVIEIFDRFHISEGDDYIVEDESMRNASGANFKHNVVIEVLDDEEDRVLELSSELKNAFQNASPSITGKMMQDEKDKISKAVVLWKPNAILKTLLSDTGDDSSNNEESEDSEGANCGVEIEEIFSDDDEEMLNCESDVDRTNTVEEDEELME